MRREVPLRRSLLVKLLLLSALVSACSIAATAWLSVRTTAVAISEQPGQALGDGARIYDTLLGYAATHRTWKGAGPTVAKLARQSHYRVTITDADRTPILDSGRPAGTSSALPTRATATIDPLAVNPALAVPAAAEVIPASPVSSQSAGPCPENTSCDAGLESTGVAVTDKIDPRAVGPFLLTSAERQILRTAAQYSVACIRVRLKTKAEIVETPSGRPSIETPQLKTFPFISCGSSTLDTPTRTESAALKKLDARVNSCLRKGKVPEVSVLLNLAWTQTAPHTANGDQAVAACITSGRIELLRSYVAPPVLLFVSTPTPSAATFLDLSSANRIRIAEVAALVMLVTITVTAVAGTRMVRPLRALASAARRMSDGDLAARVTVASSDEIGGVSTAFNTMAERRAQLEDVRTAMVSDIAHELRTPLSNIRGWLEASEDGLVEPDAALLASLLDEALLLQHVIDDLRDLSAADAGELRLQKEPVDVDELLHQVATAHRGSLQADGVTLQTRSAGRPEVVADPVRLRQAVSNLVSNAIRHTPVGGTVLLCSRTDGGEVVIDVVDSGTGIDSGDLGRVFDRFWRAEKSRSRETGGSGLGLSIVRKLAEAHGGTVSAANVVGDDGGTGAVFTLRLPRG